MSERRRERRARHTTPVPRATQITYDLPIHELLGEDGVARIHAAAMRILAEFGIDFYDEECRAILAANGATLRGQTAFFSEEVVMRHVRMAPARFVQLARNPEHNVVIGDNKIVFAPVYGPPFVQDLDGVRRDATLDDFQNFVKLAYLSPYMHHSGGTVVEPMDEPVSTRHLDMVFSHIVYSDKAFMGSVTSGPNAADSVAMAEIVFGAAAIREHPALVSLINVSSPRRYDDRMLAALKVYARARQGLLITPFILAGAMGPAAVGGSLAQVVAEALAGIALVQMIEPGCPVILGSFFSTMDLQSGALTMGTPEAQIALYCAAQMARHYNLPFRSGGCFSSSKLPDAQAGYESVMSMLPTLQARTNFVLHAAGWLDNGLAAGYAKFVLDCEICGMLHTWAKGIDLSDEALAFDALAEVPPGGHYLGTAHTMRHFRDAFYRAELFDYNSSEQWEINGAHDSYARATAKARQLLAAYAAPPLDPATEENLRAFMARRKAEIALEPRDF
jgi:trimethylamine--corrinoid protein Co-methyltransferase